MVAFRSIVASIKRKPHDVLNTHKNEFDADYVTFQSDMTDLRIRLQEFLDKKFEDISRLSALG